MLQPLPPNLSQGVDGDKMNKRDVTVFALVCAIAVVLCIRAARGSFTVASASILWGPWGVSFGLAAGQILRGRSR